MDLKELRTKRGRLVEQAREILNTAENRAATDEDNRRFDALMTEADGIKADIERRERLETEERALNESRGRITDPQTRTTTGADTELRNYLIGAYNPGPQGLTFQFEARAQSVGTATAGGHTVADEPMAALEVALNSFGGMRQAARVIRTSTGADLPIPTLNDTSNLGSIIAENTTITLGPDLTFGQVVLKAHKYSAGIIPISIEFLQDSSVNVGEMVGEALGERIARLTNGDFTIGSGTGPAGAVPAATFDVTGATLGKVTYDELVDLEHSVDASYRPNAVWMFNDTTLREIKKIKDSQGHPLWQPGLVASQPDRILGYRYIVNNDMPALSTVSAKSILFGDFNKGYFIRDVRDIQIVRLNERYADVGQIGYTALYRGDGRPVNAGTNPIKAFRNAAV